MGKLSMLPRLMEVGKFPPRMRRHRPSLPAGRSGVVTKSISKAADPHLLAEDGGPYITLPMVITKDPKRGIRNVGMYRVPAVLGPEHARNALAATQSRCGALARNGGDGREDARRDCDRRGSSVGLFGVAPLPPTIDEFLFAGFLRSGRYSWRRQSRAISRCRRKRSS